MVQAVAAPGGRSSARRAAPALLGHRRLDEVVDAEVVRSHLRTASAGYERPAAGARTRAEGSIQQPRPASRCPASNAPAQYQTAARELFGGVDPVDRRIHAAGRVYFVIGVVQDARSGFMQPEPPPTVFLPLTSEAPGRASAQGTTVVVRGAPASGTLAGVRAEVQSLYPDLTVFNLRTMRAQLDRFNELAQLASMLGAGHHASGRAATEGARHPPRARFQPGPGDRSGPQGSGRAGDGRRRARLRRGVRSLPCALGDIRRAGAPLRGRRRRSGPARRRAPAAGRPGAGCVLPPGSSGGPYRSAVIPARRVAGVRREESPE